MRSQLRGATRLILWFSFSVFAYSQTPDSFVESVKPIYSQDGLRDGNAFDHRPGRLGKSVTRGEFSDYESVSVTEKQSLRKHTSLHLTELQQDDQYYDDKFYLGGLDWTVWGSTVHEEELYIGGNFEWYNGEVRLNGIARWDGEGWQPVGDGFNGTVYALVSYNDGLIAAGDFTQSGSTSVNRIARWNGSSWQPLGDGLNWDVYALTIYNNVLIAGGYFDINNWIDVARWDGEHWLAVGEGFDNGSIYALTVYDGDLIAGGSFTQSNGAPVNGIARWNGSSWQAIGSGFDNAVEALTMYNNELIAGGWFLQSGNETVNSIARWNGSSWQPMGVGFDSDVYALIEYNGDLIAGGYFTRSGQEAVGAVARWDGNQWLSLGSEFEDEATVSTFIIFNNDLLAGGFFFNREKGINNITRYEGTEWSGLGQKKSGGLGINTWATSFLQSMSIYMWEAYSDSSVM
jgi:hypothetical protein